MSRLVRHRSTAGFTLIELMITCAVVAILAAIAYPSYKESVAKGHRAQAKTVMAQAQQWLERQYSENYNYGKTLDGTVIDSTPGGVFASQFGTAPLPGEGAANYNIAVTVAADGQSYSLTAARAGSMSQDRCGDYTITNTGRKSASNSSGFPGGGAVADLAALQACWN
jgi:type IV pilus assembly protein PilE